MAGISGTGSRGLHQWVCLGNSPLRRLDCRRKTTAACSARLAHHDQSQPVARGFFSNRPINLALPTCPPLGGLCNNMRGNKKRSFHPLSCLTMEILGNQEPPSTPLGRNPTRIWGVFITVAGENCSTINVIQLWESSPHRSTSGTHCGHLDQFQQWRPRSWSSTSEPPSRSVPSLKLSVSSSPEPSPSL